MASKERRLPRQQQRQPENDEMSDNTLSNNKMFANLRQLRATPATPTSPLASADTEPPTPEMADRIPAAPHDPQASRVDEGRGESERIDTPGKPRRSRKPLTTPVSHPSSGSPRKPTGIHIDPTVIGRVRLQLMEESLQTGNKLHVGDVIEQLLNKWLADRGSRY